MVDDGLVPNDNEVERLMKAGEVAEARQLCQRMLRDAARPINQAVLLSNIMTCFEREGDISNAVEAGGQALQVIDSNRLNWERGPDGDKAAAIRGYVRGVLSRLTGQPADWRNPTGSWKSQGLFWAAYLAPAVVGAAIGTWIQFGYCPANPTPLALRCLDARYLLAPLCGFLGQHRMYSVLRTLGGIPTTLVGLGAATGLVLFYKDLDMPQPVIAVVALLLPMVGVILFAAARSKTIGRRV